MWWIFWTLLLLKLVRYVLPWVAGFLVSLVFLAFVPMPPLFALIATLFITTWTAFELETNVFRAFERKNYHSPAWPEDPRWREWRDHRRGWRY